MDSEACGQCVHGQKHKIVASVHAQKHRSASMGFLLKARSR
jgi:hypothetical protein